MSEKLPVVSGKRMIRFLEKRGFRQARRKGSHVVLVKGEDWEITVPDHRELRKGTLRGILNDAEISREEFAREIRRC